MGDLTQVVAVLALGMGLLGCGGANEPRIENVQLTLGTSASDGTGFLPLDGDQTLVEGAQGGFHIWLKYRVTGMGAGRVLIERTARRAHDGRLILQVPEGSVDVGAPGEDGYWELPKSLPSFMCPTPIGVSVIDQLITFDVALKGESGAILAQSTASATAHCPTDTRAAFCQQICSGQ